MSSPIPEIHRVKSYLRRNPGEKDGSPLSGSALLRSNIANSHSDLKRSGQSPLLKKDELSIELERLEHYKLNVPDDDNEVELLQLDKNSPFYSTSVTRELQHKKLLPYQTETIRDQYKYLSHIIAHLYIAVKSLDLKGNLTISVNDLEKAKEALLNKTNIDEFVKSNRVDVTVEEDENFETLHHNESEANEDDDEEDDYDSAYDYSSDEDEDASNSTPVAKVEMKSASIISLKYWTKELKNLLKMGLLIPLHLTSSLIKVYYAIALSRGQGLDILFYTEVVGLLSKEKDLLLNDGLRLDWRPLYEELSSTICQPSTSGPSVNELRFKRMVSFAICVKIYFDDDSVPLIMEKIINRFTNQTSASSFLHMAVMLPMKFRIPRIDSDGLAQYSKEDIRFYLPVFFSCWANNRSDKEITCLMSVIVNVVSSCLKEGSANKEIMIFGKYGIFSKDQFTFIMNQLFLSTKTAAKDDKNVKYCKLLVQMIVGSLSSEHALDKEGIVDYLKTFGDFSFTMLHPSNSGPWSNVISQVIKKLAATLHGRLLSERTDKDIVSKYCSDYSTLPTTIKLSDDVVNSTIEILLPLVHLGVQSKSSSIRRHYISVLQTLCFIRPEFVLDNVLPDMYSSFESVNSTHRIPVVIRELTCLVRFMVQLPVYRIHVPRLLSMLVPGIDSNDPEKTILTTELIKVVAAVIPFADLTDDTGDGGLLAMNFTSQHLAYLEAKFYESAPNKSLLMFDEPVPNKFEYEPELELEALKSASSSFEEFLKQFCERCFKFLELAPSVEQDQSIESKAAIVITNAFESLVESLSDDLFDFVADHFYDYIMNNVKHDVAIVFSNIAEVIVRRAPEKQFKRLFEYLMPQIEEEIEHGAGLSRSQEVMNKDKRLIWNMKLLSGALLGAGPTVLPYIDTLDKFVVLRTPNLRGEAAFCVSLAVNSMLSTLSCIRLAEKRLVSKDWLAKHDGKITEECWGGFQFDPYRYNPQNLKFNWYKPSSREVDVVAEHFENIAMVSLEYINDFVSNFNSNEKITLEVSDQLSFHIELLEGLIRGVCSLFDPTYNLKSHKSHISKLVPVGATPVSSSLSLNNLAYANSISDSNVTNIKNNAVEAAKNNGISTSNNRSQLQSQKEDMNEEDNHDINTVNEELEKEIIKDTESDDASSMSVDVMFDSEAPSAVGTPSLGAGFDAVDSSLTERSDVLYSFGNYFSGDVISKMIDPSYKRIHQTRDDIGNSLHHLIQILSKQDGSIDLIGRIIQCISCWLDDCGYYSSNNPVQIDNIHFIDQLDLPGLYAPYTRTILGARIAVYHCSRINISRCTRLPTILDKSLIKDLVTLSSSSYSVTASQASSVLTSALNKIINCTGLVFHIFKEWEIALLNKEKERLRNIMILFDKKRFRGIAEKSTHYLEKYESLIARSIEVNEIEVSIIGLKLYRSMKKYVKIPAVVCLIDMKLVEPIRPPDIDVDFKISALKLAKDKKRAYLFSQISKLNKTVVQRASEPLHWKFLLLVLDLVSSLHSHYEIPLDSECLHLLGKCVDGRHPEVSKKGMFWIASVMDVLETKGFFKYDIANILSVTPDDPSISSLSSIIGLNNPDAFFKEMGNLTNPSFFIDNKLWVPTIAWNNELMVVNNSYPKTLGFNENDDEAVRKFTKFVNKDWLLRLLQLHIDESEANTAFLPGMVYFFSSIVTLSLYGYLDSLKFEDFLNIADSIYKADERPTHVAVTEIFCGLLLACKKNPDRLKLVDEEIAKRISHVFDNDLTQSSLNIWAIFSWWLPSHFDMRRTPKMLTVLCDFEVQTDIKKSPFGLLCRLTFLKHYMSTALNRYHNFDEIIEKLFSILAHPYNNITKKVATMLFDCIFYISDVSFKSFDEYMTASVTPKNGMGISPIVPNEKFHMCLVGFLQKTLDLRSTVQGKTPQEIANSEFIYHVRGIKSFMLTVLKTAHNTLLIPYFKDYILPLTFELDKMKDACKLAEVSLDFVLMMFASIRYSSSQSEDIIELICNDMGLKNPSLNQYNQLLGFANTFEAIRFLERRPEQRIRLIEKCVSMLYNQHLSLREKYAKLFAVLIHLFLDSEREDVIAMFIKAFKKVLKKNKKVKGKKMNTEQTNLAHGATLGLCALVEAYPYTTPPPKWLPDVLTLLEVKCSNYDGIVSRTAKNTLSQFKKTRQDTWHIDSKFFTEEQLEDLEGVLWKSYFI